MSIISKSVVTSRHSQYIDNQKKWKKIRDAAQGEEEVKDKGEKYLPSLGGQTPDQYDAYKKRALFYNATGRTIDAYEGLIFRKPPTLDVPENLEEIEHDISLRDENAKQFLKRSVRECVTTGRGGFLVDYPEVDEDPVNMAEVRASGQFPYLTMYTAEEIRNWLVVRDRGSSELRAIVLHEDLANADGFYNRDANEQYRALELLDDGTYVQRIWRRSEADDDTESDPRASDNDSSGSWFKYKEVQPRIDGEPLTKIPFYFFGAEDNTSRVDKPPLLDLANINYSHYRTSADYEHALHFTSLPTITLTGFEEGEADISVGPESAIFSENEEAEAGMLEYEGKGLSEVKSALDEKMDMMADLGARMVMDQDGAREATETVQLKQRGNSSVIASIAENVSRAYKSALNFASKWKAGSLDHEPESSVQANKDLFPRPIGPNMIEALMKLNAQGKITTEILIDNLKRGEIVAEDKSAEEIMEQIDAEGGMGSLADL